MTLSTDARTHQGPSPAQPAVPNEGSDIDPAQNPPVAEIFSRAVGPVTEPTNSLASRVTNCDSISWTPFPMPGTSFKLLNINETTGATTILLNVSEGAEAPLHRHLGGAEAYNIFGTWAYEGEVDPIGPNCYVLSIRAIASEMRRAPSTISRELKRNTVSVRGYMPHTAHRLSVKHRARPRQAKLVANAELRSYVQGKLAKRWSPQQISHRLIKDFPTTPEMRASTETIYQAIYVHARGDLTRELGKQLRCGRIARKPHRQSDARRPRFVDPMNSISNRPAEVDSRKVPGHWEGDLIIGALGGSAIATLVERSSRFVMLGYLGRERTAEAVRDSLITTVHNLPASL